MKIHTVLIVGLGLITIGCSESEQAGSEPPVEVAMSTPEAAAPWEGDDSWRNSAFMEHMHLHAERLDELNFALADGDLNAAMTPAKWLATHETFEDVQSGLVKAAVFGFIVSLMGCYHGYNSKGGAQGVGRATTNAVVSACILILCFDYILTEMFFAK